MKVHINGFSLENKQEVLKSIIKEEYIDTGDISFPNLIDEIILKMN